MRSTCTRSLPGEKVEAWPRWWANTRRGCGRGWGDGETMVGGCLGLAGAGRAAQDVLPKSFTPSCLKQLPLPSTV